MLARYMLSSCVRLSVRLSVTSRYCIKIAKRRIGLTENARHKNAAQYCSAGNYGKRCYGKRVTVLENVIFKNHKTSRAYTYNVAVRTFMLIVHINNGKVGCYTSI